jgi:hypothetical protein
MSSITREAVLQMDLKSILAAVKDQTTSKDMQLLLRDRSVASRVSELMLEAQNREAEVDTQLARVVPPSTEQLAAEAAAMAAETPVVPVAAAEAVTPSATANPFETEDIELKKIGITVIRDAKFAATRYIEDYHVRDEDGTPIGRATHLEARTLSELMAKKQEVHTQATRAFHRLKKQKLTFKQEPRTILSPEAIQEAARIALEAKDPGKVTDVIEQVIETKYSERELEVKKAEWRAQGRQIALEFQRNHLHDYNPCEANNKALGMYVQDNNLEYNLESLEAAFIDLMDQNKLVKVEGTFAQRQAAEVDNPTPAAAVATPAQPEIPAAETVATVTASAAPAPPAAPSQPVAEATAPTPAAAHNVQPAARRPGVSSGIVPGTLSAQRPGAPDPALARKEFLKIVREMKPEIMKHKLKTDPQFVKQLEAYGIKVR